MSDYVPEISPKFPVIPPSDCPAVWNDGAGDLRTALFSLEVEDWEHRVEPEAPQGFVVTEVAIFAVFARVAGDTERTVESDHVQVPVGDPLIERAEGVRGDPKRLEALRRELCAAVLRCPGVCMHVDGGLGCGALTAARLRAFLEAD